MRRNNLAPKAADSPPVRGLAWKARTCAANLDISESEFKILCEEKVMPKSIDIPGHPRLVLWDSREVLSAWDAIVSGTDDIPPDNWDDVR
ncbi:MAG: hypothetical protein V4527_00555 [Pseudomonadota bacterium]